MKTIFLTLSLFCLLGFSSCSREMENLGLQKIEKSLYGSWEYSDDKKITERKLSFQKGGKFTGLAIWTNCSDKKNIWDGVYELIEDDFKNPALKLKYSIDGVKIKEEIVPIQLDGEKLKFGNYDYERKVL